MTTLFEQLGEAAVDATVDILYRKVLSDDSICRFFDDVDMGNMRAMQKNFLAMAFGGPNNYTGASLREAHAPLVKLGLDTSHFAAFAGHLKMALQELGVPSELINQAMSIVGSTHDDVLGL